MCVNVSLKFGHYCLINQMFAVYAVSEIVLVLLNAIFLLIFFGIHLMCANNKNSIQNDTKMFT